MDPTTGTAAAESAIMLIDPRSGRTYPAAPRGAVVLPSLRRPPSLPLILEIHRMGGFAYDEHVLVDHRLLVNLGHPVRFGWRRGDRPLEATLPAGGLCLQSDGDSNAPRWTDPMTFAAVAVPPATVERLLEERAPRPHETFAERRCVADPTALGFVRALAAELASPTEPLFAEALSLAFVLHLLSAHGLARGTKRLAPRGKLGAAGLRAAAELARSRLASGITLGEMAAAGGYSPFQFARLFKATTGLAPHQFVLRLRLERAQALIRAGEAGLAEISAASGFYDQAHMTNTFRRALGTTPAAHAASLRGPRIAQDPPSPRPDPGGTF